MKIFKSLLLTILTILVIWFLNNPIGSVPALGPLLDPVKGFMASAEPKNLEPMEALQVSGISGKVDVFFDDRLVPHIFAESEDDLYFAQGYVTAKFRLWQMEMTAFASAGRVSEKLGEAFLPYDRLQRRLGMLQSAEEAMAAMDSNDPVMKAILSYSNGVNAYINDLDYKHLPVEYKLMGFQPEEWTPLNTFLLQKYMSNTLTGYDDDAAFTNVLRMLGSDDFHILFPERYTGIDPIIPSGTVFENQSAEHTEPLPDGSTSFYAPNPDNRSGEEQGGIGSNNWAVSGSMTASGKPILCNDPHLPLNLPSLWFEVQLNAPGIQVYGVSLPGAPLVVIGFNEQIAWGITNAGWDVRDWYRIKTDPSHPDQYLYEGEWRPMDVRIEEIKIKGGKNYYDTIRSTHHGPMVYDGYNEKYSGWGDLAMKWAAHLPSNELQTFFLLNRAKNYAEYYRAVSLFSCPAQNIAFADKNGDIALTVSGRFAEKYIGQGRTILDGSIQADEWGAFIPFDENPKVKNPERGFVSSANQHPTDTSYPYYYTGFDFEHFRNGRINFILSSLSNIVAADMEKLQQDVFNTIASESLPLMLSGVQKLQLDEAQQHWMNKLKSWDFQNDPESELPTLFQLWWNNYTALLWDEFADKENIDLVMPKHPVTIASFQLPEDYVYFDNQSTTETETRSDIIQSSFLLALSSMDSLEQLGDDASSWYQFKGTSIMHLAQLLPFSRPNVFVGGNKNIVNATSAKNGPSWRMVVELGDAPVAHAIYPGGQSGNPGSLHYDDFVDDWAAGHYYAIQFFKTAEEAAQKTNSQLVISHK